MKKFYGYLTSKSLLVRQAFGWLLVCLFGAIPSLTSAQTITGTVFRDFDANGVYTPAPTSGTYTYGEPGVSGVIVTAYASNGTSFSTTTNASGSYTLTVGSNNPFRVEFTGLLTGDYESRRGTQNATSVQFVTGGTAGVNFGVNYPQNFCQASPNLAVACFVSGDPLASGSTSAAEDAIVLVPYDIPDASTTKPTPLAIASEVGSVWGSAVQRSTQKLFSAAFLKRHVGLGRLGLGGIYVTTLSGPTSTTFVDIENLGVNLGQTTLGTRNLPATATNSSIDANAFNLVGKVGLGSMALSDDESKLYVVDLFNRRLIRLDIGNPAKATVTAADMLTIALPTTTCTDGVARPFAIKVYRGKVYVGIVCTGENNLATSPTNLRASVFEMDEATLTFNNTPVLSFPLDYTKGYIHFTQQTLGNEWSPWVSNFSSLFLGGSSTAGIRIGRAQPMLSSIDFTDRGDMVLGLMDRGGHQLGYQQRSTDATDTQLYNGYIGGDVLMARRTSAGWTLESNGSLPATSTLPAFTGTGVGNAQGPGGGEFYALDRYPETGTPTHEETFQGGLAVIPGKGEVVVTAMDPLTVWSGGFNWFNSTNGTDEKRYEIYLTVGTGANPITYGKANGLGIISAVCAPAPIQIGNRVWRDLDNDGVQDANEPALPGVVVTLKGPGLPTAGVSVTTNASGEYYFANTSGTAATGYAFSLTGLTQGGSYSLTFPQSTSANTLVLSQNANTATGTNADAIDTDANGQGLITFTLGQAGQNNFSYDVAYVIEPCALTATANPSTCDPVTNRYSVSGTISLTNTTGGTATITDGTRSTTVSIAASATSVAYSLTGLTSGTGSHTVTVSLPNCDTATITYNAPASCTVAATVSVTSATICYGTSTTLTASGCLGTVSWSNGTTATTLVTPVLTQATNYTVTCTTPSATTSAIATVTVLPQPVLNLTASSTLVTVGSSVTVTAQDCAGTVSWSNGSTGTSIVVMPTQPTQTYSATCTTGPACFTTASIGVNTEAPANLIVTSATVCYGTSATLTAAGCAGTIVWSNGTSGNTLVTPALTQTTSYTATCTTATSTTFAVGTVTVLPQPVLNLSASSTLVTVGSSVTLSAQDCAGTVTWSNGSTGTSIVVLPTQPTQTYSATCTTGPACFTTASIGVNTEAPANLIVTSATVCYGTSATLTAAGCAGTIVWSNGTSGNTLVTPALTQTTSYTATCTTATSTTFAVGTVTVLPQPVLNLSASSTLVTVGSSVTLSAQDCAGTVTWSNGSTGASIVVTPTQPTQTYSATCTTGPACFTSASIVVNTEAPANLVVTSATVCFGTSATLTAAGCAGTISWSNGTSGNTLVTPALTQTTSYTATCTTATSTTFAVGTVTVLPQPVLNLTASSTLVTVGSSVTLTATGCAGTVAWSNGSTGTSIVVTPTQPTQTYSATCTTGPACFTSSSIGVNTVPPCSVSLVVTHGTCQSATNTFSATATLTVMNLIQPESATISIGGTTQVFALSALTTNSVQMTVDNLAANGASLLATAILSTPQCASTQAAFDAPNSCAGSPNLVLSKAVSTSAAQFGDVISYTITLTNTGPVTATSVVVNDAASPGISIIPGSVTVSAGSFTPSLTGGSWAIASLPANATATLVYSVSVETEGVIYNTASIPGNDNQVCTSIPYRVCKGQPFAMRLEAPTGFSRYQWYLTAPGATTATLVADGTLNSFTATLPGAYQVVIDEGVNGQCPQSGCCPIVIEEVEVPLFTVLTQNPTCVGSEPQANGQLSITGLTDPRRYTYQYSVGTSFDAATAVPATATSLPVSGVIGTGLLANNYTVRLTDRQTGCFRDVTVALVANCTCPTDICIPVTIKKIVR
ncbi:SdrD B-like domain-containing protein [Rudanella lutea]|uniref:SdrD B-like domain-containing protein n=1 Tax=Rudanella lutea TaxID=451374 RepID=UPI00037A224B|nr:SdrD B-like domain-containing protein [Rudanella lutea]